MEVQNGPWASWVLAASTRRHGAAAAPSTALTRIAELCLSVKTSPNMYDYDSSAWFPLVYPVKSDVKAEDTTNGVAARKSEKANGNGAAKHVKN